MNIAWSSDFSYEYFKKILQTAKSNFELHLFRDVSQVLHTLGQRKLFLRHDIDIDLGRALEMATIEKACGVCSTYMVMLNSPTYNIEEKASRTILQQLISMGNEIGLHFDLNSEKRNTAVSVSSVESDINEDLKKLEEIIQLPVHSISFHRPLPQFLHGSMKIAGRINAYSQELMSWYLSDSAGRWREGEPLQKLQTPNGDLLQLLIHPIWWGDEHVSASERLENYFITKTENWKPEQIEAFDKALGQHIGVRRSGKKNNLGLGHFPESGKFDTDAATLVQRIESHKKFGSDDLDKWIFKYLDIKKGASILDIGCGTGKQTIPAAKLTGDTGRVVAFDVSQKALEILLEEARQSAIDNPIIFKCGDIDDLDKHLDAYFFDRVLGSYSLYYAKDPEVVFQTVYKRLNPGGILFFCGPSKENNAELKMFHRALLKEQAQDKNRSAAFMEETGAIAGENIFY